MMEQDDVIETAMTAINCHAVVQDPEMAEFKSDLVPSIARISLIRCLCQQQIVHCTTPVNDQPHLSQAADCRIAQALFCSEQCT